MKKKKYLLKKLSGILMLTIFVFTSTIGVGAQVMPPFDEPSYGLEIVKSVDKTEAKPGDQLQYTITITNNSCRHVKFNIEDEISDYLQGIGIVSVTKSKLEDTCESTQSISEEPENVILSDLVYDSTQNKITGNDLILKSGEILTIVYNATIKNDAANGTVIKNSAKLTYGGSCDRDIILYSNYNFELQSEYNGYNINTILDGEANLEFQYECDCINEDPIISNETETIVKFAVLESKKSVSAAEVNRGDMITYTVEVKNTGLADSGKVTIEDTLPQGLTDVKVNNNGTLKDGKITWTIDSIKAGETALVTFSAKVDTDSLIKNVSYVNGSPTNIVTTSVKAVVKAVTTTVKAAAVKTGDNNLILIWSILCCVSASGIIINKKLRKSIKNN